MTGFDESLHPRGHAANAGQFAEKAHSAPDDTLTDAASDQHTNTWRILADRLGDFSKAVEKPALTSVEGDPSMRCGHCGQFRGRQKVFTLRDRETGELKHIGSNCLSLFLGAKPEGLWAMAREVGAELRFDEESVIGGSSKPNACDGADLLLATIRQVDADGGEYLSRSRAGLHNTPTVDKVVGSFDTRIAAPATQAERDEVEAIAAWAVSLEPGDDGYLQNLKAAFTRSSADGELVVYSKHAGLPQAQYPPTDDTSPAKRRTPSG